jgi:hypothetical protein
MQASKAGNGSDTGGGKDVDKQIRRLFQEIRSLKDKISGTADAAQPMSKFGDGDHAMLSAKPVFGYRCMACDRPLDKLDESPGPYRPQKAMPTRTTEASDRTSPKRDTGTAGALRSREGPVKLKAGSYDPAARGPQTWYCSHQTTSWPLCRCDLPCRANGLCPDS